MQLKVFSALKRKVSRSSSEAEDQSQTPTSPLANIQDPSSVTLRDIFIDTSLSPALLPLFRDCAKQHFMPETVQFYEQYLQLRQSAQPGYVPGLLSNHPPPMASGGAVERTPRPRVQSQNSDMIELDQDQVKALIEAYVNPSSPTSLNLSGALRKQLLDCGVVEQAQPVPTKLVDMLGKEAGRHMQGNLLPVFRTHLEAVVRNEFGGGAAGAASNTRSQK